MTYSDDDRLADQKGQLTNPLTPEESAAKNGPAMARHEAVTEAEAAVLKEMRATLGNFLKNQEAIFTKGVTVTSEEFQALVDDHKLHSYSSADAPKRWSDPMDLKLTYYLSGPMKGYPDHNWPAFQHASEVLRNTGITVISPHEVNPMANKTVSERYPLEYLQADVIEMVSQCSGLILLKGWPSSRGARVELELALSLEWPIWFYDEYRLTAMSDLGDKP